VDAGLLPLSSLKKVPRANSTWAPGTVLLISTATLRMRTVDWTALAIFAFEIPSVLFSQHRVNSVRASEAVAISVLVYFVLRLTIHTRLRTAWLAGLLGLGGAWLAFSGILQFVAGTEPLAEAGLTDLVAFRSRLIHPIHGWVPGECFTVFLLALPFACAAAANLWQNGSSPVQGQRKGQGGAGLALLALLPAVPIVAALSLSLSRAVFWSTVLFFFLGCALMLAYRVITLRTGSLLLAGALGALLTIMACETALYPGIFKAYAGSHTSQARSTQGRLGIWSRSLELVRGHPMWGVGSSNAALSLLSTADQEETTGFASRAFSLPIQVLVEKGAVGFALYTAFLFLLALEFHRGMRSPALTTIGTISPTPNRKRKKAGRPNNEERLRLQGELAYKAMKCCFAAGLVAVLFRELTYSSLLEHALTLSLAFTLAALMSAGEPA
jgi:O-Antigen ligase